MKKKLKKEKESLRKSHSGSWPLCSCLRERKKKKTGKKGRMKSKKKDRMKEREKTPKEESVSHRSREEEKKK